MRQRDLTSLRPLIAYLLAVLTGVLLMLLSSCRTCKPCAESESAQRYEQTSDTVHNVKWRVDSVFVRDSVVTVIRGDTVLTDRWHTRERIKLRTDTVERIRTRIVYRTCTKTVTVTMEKPLAWWQETLMWIGGILLCGGALAVAVRLRRKG